jgi:hypothetical protein
MSQQNLKRKKIPIWICSLIVLSSTILAFWIFGGQNYCAHSSEIEYSYFTHEDDSANPFCWCCFLLETGVPAAYCAFWLSILTVSLINLWSSRSNEQSIVAAAK